MRKRDLEAIAEAYAQQLARYGFDWSRTFESSKHFATALALAGAITEKQAVALATAVHRHAVAYGQTYAGVVRRPPRDTVLPYVPTERIAGAR